MNSPYLLQIEDNAVRTGCTKYFLHIIETKEYNAKIHGKTIFWSAKDKLTYENITKNATGQRDDYTIGCLLDYSHF